MNIYDNAIYTELGNRMKELRLSKHLSLSALSHTFPLYIAKSTLHRWETGGTKVSWQKLCDWSKALGIKPPTINVSFEMEEL